MKTVRILLILFLSLNLSASLRYDAEEGMYPLSEIQKLNLQQSGLQIGINDIYNPNGVSLIDALVKINGCTGSFVSDKGLMITNHHCAFGAISNVSTPEKNYLENGFLAESFEAEIPAKNYVVRITESYEDVTAEILKSVEGIEDLSERNKAISKKMREIAKSAEDEANSIVAEVSEMFAGESYVLFKYRIIKDVRLVYAPPRSIGEFGGEADNWIWPRHTGDFTFMRAYVAPDGSAAEYSEKNIPYTPKKYLKVNPDGVDEGDFVFILGYPGRTFRHNPSQFLEYQENFNLPYTEQLYSYMIGIYESISEGNEELQIKYSSRIKSLANVMKNYRGKMLGLRRLNLVEKKQSEEKILAEFINSDENLKKKFGTLFKDIEEVYQKRFDIAEADLWFSRFFRFSDLVSLADFILEYSNQKELINSERKSAFKEDKIEETLDRMKKKYEDLNYDFEDEFIYKMLYDTETFSETSTIKAVKSRINGNDFEEAISKYIEELLSTEIGNLDFFNKALELSYDEINDLNDPLIDFVVELKKQKEEIEKQESNISGALQVLMPKLAEVKKLKNKTTFTPDANSTLRLTYGFIKGYEPADAVFYKPITTLDGIIEKSFMGGEYAVPDKLKTAYQQKDFGRFYDEKVGGVPVAILYNTDTTGGNSGSPILNAKGELIGVNFDRAFEATINDFAWDDAYSRSIGVDIRYVLWVAKTIGNADNVLNELGVK
ncbi:MAG: S46 family peptidase [Melioribacteraceae bacterium]|nr:S46 family peptidase [Melioribacteraceae bacterium]